MTLAEALAKVRYLLDEPTAKMWADAELEGYISQGQKAMCQRRGIEEVWTAEISAAETVELPTDFATIYKLDVEEEEPEYFFFNHTIRFDEAQTGTLTVYGTRAPDTLTSAVDFQVPDAFADGAVYYACWAANQKDENYQEAGYYRGLFEQKKQEWERSRKYAPSGFGETWQS